MTNSKRGPWTRSRVLATDLDGTLIPLEGCDRNTSDLAILKQQLLEHSVTLVFVTGRHFDSVRHAIIEHQLPTPDWIICDVGTTIFQRRGEKEFIQLPTYGEHLASVAAGVSVGQLRSHLAAIDRLRPQEAEKQGPFKLSYYANAEELDALIAEIVQLLDSTSAPYSVIHSIDPFNGDGLIDLLPLGVSKAYALNWWSRHMRISPEEIVYSGDSGNDLAALLAGYRTIVVGNAHRALAEQVHTAHQNAGWRDRLYLAREHATSGVLAGCRTFQLFDDLPTD